MHIVIYGPEGSGKGTQAKLLSEKLDLQIYTAGDLVREAAVINKGRIGDMARSVLLEGKYLPDVEMCNLIGEKLKDKELKRGFILDGFPRTLSQAKFLTDSLSKNGYKIDKVIYLRLDENESVRRLVKRKRTVFGKSKILHDDPKRIKQRLKIFHREEKSLLGFFKEKKLLLEIKADQTIEHVFRDIVTGLGLSL